jgi:hypothetical protein
MPDPGRTGGGGAVPARVPRPPRAWLWVALLALMVASLCAGIVLRAGVRGGGGAAVLLVGAFGVLAVLYLAAEVMVVLQEVQAREAARTALATLPPPCRVSGRVRVRGAGGRPVLVDHVVAVPGGSVYAVVVDGSTRPPRPGDSTDGLGPLVPRARRAAAAIAAAAAAGVLPERLGVGAGACIRPCILVVRRPLAPGERAGVLAVAGADVQRLLPDPPRPPAVP